MEFASIKALIYYYFRQWAIKAKSGNGSGTGGRGNEMVASTTLRFQFLSLPKQAELTERNGRDGRVSRPLEQIQFTLSLTTPIIRNLSPLAI